MQLIAVSPWVKNTLNVKLTHLTEIALHFWCVYLALLNNNSPKENEVFVGILLSSTEAYLQFLIHVMFVRSSVCVQCWNFLSWTEDVLSQQDNMVDYVETLLAMIALTFVQSSTSMRIHNIILFIDTSTMFNTTMLIL